MLEDENVEKLDKAEQNLNSLEYKPKNDFSDLEKQEFDVAKNWNEIDVGENKAKKTNPDVTKFFVEKKGSMMKYILLVSFIFFIGAFAFAAMTFWKGSNISSSENIDFSIFGPSSVEGGEETALQIFVANKNTVPMKDVELYLEFPRSVEVVGDELENQRLHITIGNIDEGGVANETIKVIFWGEEKSVKVISGELGYQFDNSNAELKKSTEYSVDLLSSPIGVRIEMLKEATSRQQIEISITVSSEKENAIKNTILEVDYPNGFTFTESVPEPTFGDNKWDIGNLDSFRDKKVVILGVIEGEDTEEKTFRTTVGTQSSQDPNMIGIPLNKVAKQVVLTKSFIGLDFIVGNDPSSSFSPIEGGKTARVKLQWINNDDTKIVDAEIEVKILGDFHPGRTNVEGGFFQTTNNTAIWNQKTSSEYAVLEPQKSGVAIFEVAALPILSEDGVLLKNPTITLEASASARRIADLNVPDSTNAPVIKILRFNTIANLTARIVHNIGPFINTGPMPPRANHETTYTVIWQITNTANDLQDVIVRAKLPTYVNWKGIFSPKGEDLEYDEITGEVIWNIPIIPAGSGVINDAIEVAFQVGIIPSLTQVRTSPLMMTETTLLSTDSFTKVQIKDLTKKLTTAIDTDPLYNKIEGLVIE